IDGVPRDRDGRRRGAVACGHRRLATAGRCASGEDLEVALADARIGALGLEVGWDLAGLRRRQPLSGGEVDDVELRAARAALREVARGGEGEEPLADAVRDRAAHLAGAGDLEELRVLPRQGEGLVAGAAVVQRIAVAGEREARAGRVDGGMRAIAEGRR